MRAFTSKTGTDAVSGTYLTAIEIHIDSWVIVINHTYVLPAICTRLRRDIFGSTFIEVKRFRLGIFWIETHLFVSIRLQAFNISKIDDLV